MRMCLTSTFEETIEHELLEAYCLGKSKLWNLFFGFRSASTTPTASVVCYKLNEKDYQYILKRAKKIENHLDDFFDIP